jgi:hypothetical protein
MDGVPAQRGVGSITQNADTFLILPTNSISCNDSSGLHSDNSYMRRFDLDGAHGLSGSVDVTSVRFGVEDASSGSAAGQPLTVNLYEIPAGSPLLFPNLMMIGSVSNPAFLDQGLTTTVVDVTGTVTDAVAYDLVVEIFTPNGQSAGHSFFIGSNSSGQTAPSYIAAASCSVPEPTDVATLGFPGMHVVMSVNIGAGDGCMLIPDDGYDGTIGSMACLTIPGPPTNIVDLDVKVEVDHTFVGDLTFKVKSPSQEVLTLVNRPGYDETADDGSGCCGNDGTMSSAFPVKFDDDSINSAETMGASGLAVCAGDGICDFSPFPGTGPGANLGQFNGQDATGDWMLCVGDSASADTGQLCGGELIDEGAGIFTDGFESGDTTAWQ